MLKASALYIVIIIALVIAVICSSLIVTAYYYRLEYQKAFRYTLLQTNLGSAENILLADLDTAYTFPKVFSLFQKGNDSVSTQKIFWGAFDVEIAKAFIQRDTLYKAFSTANTIDSSKWAAIYLKDDHRPLSLCGKTMITGNVFISASGVNQAFLENTGYSGDPRLIIGAKYNSYDKLPILDTFRLARLHELIKQYRGQVSTLNENDSVNNSFILLPKLINLGNRKSELQNITLTGNVILFCDTALTIDSTAILNNIIVFAKSITVKSSFKGTCQLFATDTIAIGKNVTFNYPSCLGIIRFNKKSIINTQAKITLYEKDIFNGLIFAYEKNPSASAPLIHLRSKTKIIGQIYSPGAIELDNLTEIYGSIFTAKFLYQNNFAVYENYINNTTINEKRLSPYYLTSSLFPVATKKKKTLQWLEGN